MYLLQVSPVLKKNYILNNISSDLYIIIAEFAENSTKNVPAIKINRLSLSTLRSTKWHNSSSIRNLSLKKRNKEKFCIYETYGLDPFAPSTTEDPFIKKLDKLQLTQRKYFSKSVHTHMEPPYVCMCANAQGSSKRSRL